jgi:RNA polymerase sigma factor (sigma-70 family)
LRFASDITQVSEGDQEPAATQPTAEEAFAEAELLSVVSAAIETLHEDERQIVRRFYFDGEKMEDIAASLSMHKSWVSRIHTRAIALLTKRLRGVAG